MSEYQRAPNEPSEPRRAGNHMNGSPKSPPVQRQSVPPRRERIPEQGYAPRPSSGPYQADSRLILPGPDDSGQGRRQVQYGPSGNVPSFEREPQAPPSGPLRAVRQTATPVDDAQVAMSPETVNTLFIFADVVLVLAIVAVLFLIGRRLGNGFNAASLLLLLPELVIYVLCVFAGYLWGRYQADTLAKRENEMLRGRVQRRNTTIEQLTERVRLLEAERDMMMRQSPVRGGVLSNAPVSPPVQRSSVSIYDVVKDPPDFEQERNLYPHEAAQVLNLPGRWHLLAGSRRGYGHSYEGKYREDAFAVREFGTNYPKTVLVAIADGVSSKTYSRWGALAAVQGAMGISEQDVATLTQSIQGRMKSKVQPEECERMAGTLLLKSLRTAFDAVQSRAREGNVSVNELHSTLLVFLVTFVSAERAFVASVQVGDGALVSLSSQQWRYEQHPQINSGNEVQAFIGTNESDWQQALRFSWLEKPAFLLGMTDGVADDLEPPPPSQDNPSPNPFVYIDEFRRAIVDDVVAKPSVAEELLKFLGYKKKQSHDDRTIVCLYREPGA